MLNCPKCGGPTQCLAGASAHPNNWYCENEEGCGWRAWVSPPSKADTLVKQLEDGNVTEAAAAAKIKELQTKWEEASCLVEGFVTLLSEADAREQVATKKVQKLEHQLIYSFHEERYPIFTYLNEACELSTLATVEELNGIVDALRQARRVHDDEHWRDLKAQALAASNKLDRAGHHDEAALIVQMVNLLYDE